MSMVLIQNSKGNNIGMYDKDRNVFVKHGVKVSKHLYKKLDAWGIDGVAFHNILKPNCTIVVEEVEERKRYEAKREDFEEFNKHLHFNEHGLQVFLPREKWKVDTLK